MKVPSFEKEWKKEQQGIREYNKLVLELNTLGDKFREIKEKYSISIPYVSSPKLENEDKDFFIKKCVDKYKADNLPNKNKIEQAIILSSNKDLGELVEELVKEYSK